MAVGIVVLLSASPGRMSAQQNPGEAVRIGDNDLGGVVTSARAGSRRLGDRRDHRPAHQIRQDRGHRRSRALPHTRLPKANYSVWVRGYGLVDSPKVQSGAREEPGSEAVAAPDAAAAARILSGDLLVFAC